MSESTKGAQTRARILSAAATLFSERSFDRVSVREIAKAAGVDPALINHYFGSKEGLFTTMLEEYLQPARIEEILSANPTTDDWGRQLVRAAEAIWTSPAGQVMLAATRRAFASNTDTLRSFVTRMMLDRIAAHLEGDDAERHLRASLVASQISGLIVARHIIGVPPLAELTSEQVVELIGPTIQRYLLGSLGC
ncbi:TetR/AcrR family transcriptional regulator [Corynebacterium falsenii]|uniref:TetR/AcrR family transcriptional regulator n=1 Tax=Corynebacterium falsenii TaxID=108486 RepID=UPI003FD1DFDC